MYIHIIYMHNYTRNDNNELVTAILLCRIFSVDDDVTSLYQQFTVGLAFLVA